MKKKYYKPEIEFLDVDTPSLLCGSLYSKDRGITYGGEDDEGLLDPSAREFEDDF